MKIFRLPITITSSKIIALSCLLIDGLVFCSFADIDECMEGTSGCQQNCTNSPGSYSCACNVGYTLNANKTDCIKGNLTMNCV